MTSITLNEVMPQLTWRAFQYLTFALLFQRTLKQLIIMYGKINTVWFSSYFLLLLLYQTWNLFPSPHSSKKVVLEMCIFCSLVNLKIIYTASISHQTCFTRKLHSCIDLQCQEKNCISLKICSSPSCWRHGTHLKYFQTSFHIKIR